MQRLFALALCTLTVVAVACERSSREAGGERDPHAVAAGDRPNTNRRATDTPEGASSVRRGALERRLDDLERQIDRAPSPQGARQ